MATSSNIYEVLQALRDRQVSRPYYNEDGTKSKYACEQDAPSHEAYWPVHNPNDLQVEVTDWRDNSPE
jgi:hypothetical protein